MLCMVNRLCLLQNIIYNAIEKGTLQSVFNSVLKTINVHQAWICNHAAIT